MLGADDQPVGQYQIQVDGCEDSSGEEVYDDETGGLDDAHEQPSSSDSSETSLL